MGKPEQHDKESEQALLTAMLLDSSVYRKAQVVMGDFYFAAHQTLYRAIGELDVDDLKVDFVTIFQHLKDRGWLEQVGGIPFLTGLNESGFATAANWSSYVKIIKQKSAARKLIALSQSLHKYATNGAKDIPLKIDQTIQELTAIKEHIGKRRTIAEDVKEWALVTSGNFLVTDCYRDLGLVTTSDKNTARQALVRLAKDHLLKPCGEKRGCYRTVENESPVIDFLNADCSTVYPISFPFELEKLVNIYPKNIIVVAGASNAGKTAFMLNLVKQNMYDHEIVYFSSETGPEEMKLRLSKFNMPLDAWKFQPRERSANFADAIVPDALNIIDYLELTDNFFQVGGDIKAIFDRLNKGICIIAIQKKGNQELARGAEFTLEKARLYLSMNPGELKIVKGKNWAQPGRNPNGMVFKFKLLSGAEFLEYE